MSALEKDWVREPCFAAWVATLCPDAAFVAQHRAAIEKIITHYPYDRLYLSQFFSVESAWYRLPLPNVVLILADDLGWTGLACFGSDVYETPHIDRLARTGMKFTQAYPPALSARRRARP